jgi:gamma-glutamylcyclotransferase (GGCT)/AIG2-like uncharacterized protein YtfP
VKKAKIENFDLYNFGLFPGIVKGSGIVYGELHEYNDNSILTYMDYIEGFDINQPENSLYLREEIEVITENNCKVTAYVYVFNGNIKKAKQIKSGIW